MRPGGSRRQKADARRHGGSCRRPSGVSSASRPNRAQRLSPPRATRQRTMDLVYGIPLIAALALAWLAARHVINKARQQRELLRRQRRRSRSKYRDAPETISSRSDMRSTDAPVTIAENIRKRERAPKEDGAADKPPGRRS